jgi:hypothetical protein
MTPSDPPTELNASNNVVPEPSVHTRPTAVGKPLSAWLSKVNVMPVAPSALKKE